MAIINDSFDIQGSKPIIFSDLVGPGRKYTSKESIPSFMRYVFMKTTDEAGVMWRLEGGIEDTDWVIYISAGTVASFTDLADTPADYIGAAGKFLAVNAASDAVEFVVGELFVDAPADTLTYGRKDSGWVQTARLDSTGGNGTAGVLWTGTEAQYTALGAYDNNTIYFIED